MNLQVRLWSVRIAWLVAARIASLVIALISASESNSHADRGSAVASACQAMQSLAVVCGCELWRLSLRPGWATSLGVMSVPSRAPHATARRTWHAPTWEAR